MRYWHTQLCDTCHGRRNGDPKRTLQAGSGKGVPPRLTRREGERLRRLRALLAVMLRPHPLAHLRQQLLPKLLLTKTARHQPRRIGLNSSPSASPRLSSNALSSCCRPAGLSLGMPHSPSNRSTRNHAGRFERASKFAGQLLQAKLFKVASATTSFARAGFKWT